MKKSYLVFLLLSFLPGQGFADANVANGPTVQAVRSSTSISAANDQDGAAMYLLASMFAEGVSVPQDDTAAFRWYVRAAALRNADAMNRIGVAYAIGRGVPAASPSEALHWFLRAAESGSVDGMCNLAKTYYRGDAGSVNYSEAAKWFERAAKQGDASAMNDLATMYEQGRGVAQDHQRAFALFQQSAGLGDGLAMLNLAALYANGEAVKQDDVAALVWFSRALEAGVPETKRAMVIRDIEAIALRLTVDQLAEARTLIDSRSSRTERRRTREEPLRSTPNNLSM